MMQQILDATCGGRMMWYDKDDTRILAMDCRSGKFPFAGNRVLNIEPDVVADFRKMPYLGETFSVVVFDPPHLINAGERSWLAVKYGTLNRETWGSDIRQAIDECFRVLKHGGVLYFKWCTEQISRAMIEAIFPYKPVFITGHHKTYHYLFIKP